MTLVSDDPGWWPVINSYRATSYPAVAVAAIVTYDWALTFGQEVELIWRQRWSLMTVLYLSVRYLGMLYAILNILSSVPTILLTDTECLIVFIIGIWTNVGVIAMLEVIIIARLHAMYQRSRKILIFLVVTFLVDNIFSVVIAVMMTMNTSAEELILSGTYQCSIASARDFPLLAAITWMACTVWEALALCLAVWIVVKHLRELRQYSAGGIVGNCFKVLMKTHMFYFSSFVAVSCLSLVNDLTPMISVNNSPLGWFLQLLQAVQVFVFGPRLILGVREYHAKLVADSDAATGMTSIAFQERVHILTGNGV